MVKNSLLDLKERKREDNITADKMIKINKNVIKDIRNPFRMKKENEVIKERIIRDIRNLIEQPKKDYYKPFLLL